MQENIENKIVEQVAQELEKQKDNIPELGVLLVNVPNYATERHCIEVVEWVKRVFSNVKILLILGKTEELSMNWIVPQDFTFEELKAYLEQK